jgi:Gpi18-like mannosyltransferase
MNDKLTLPETTMPKTSKLSGLFINFDFLIMLIFLFMLTVFKYNLFSFETSDYKNFLVYWYDYLSKYGFGSFKDSFYNYSPAYIYLLYFGTLLNLPSLLAVKMISLIFDFSLAFAVSKLVGLRYQYSNFIQYIAFLLVYTFPTVLVNSSLWGQCDSIWSSFVCWSLYFAMKNKNYLSFFFYGIAFSFKLQALFILPLFVFLILNNYYKLKEILLGGLIFFSTYFATILPSFLLGRPLWSTKVDGLNVEGLLNIYLNQTEYSNTLVNGATPNLYAWTSSFKYNLFYPSGVILTCIVMIILIINFRKMKMTKDRITGELITLALIFNTAFVFFSPKMHERYFFLSEFLALIYIFYKPKNWLAGLAIIIPSMFGQWRAISGEFQMPFIFEYQWGALFVLCSLIYITYEFIKGSNFKFIIKNF